MIDTVAEVISFAIEEPIIDADAAAAHPDPHGRSHTARVEITPAEVSRLDLSVISATSSAKKGENKADGLADVLGGSRAALTNALSSRAENAEKTAEKIADENADANQTAVVAPDAAGADATGGADLGADLGDLGADLGDLGGTSTASRRVAATVTAGDEFDVCVKALDAYDNHVRAWAIRRHHEIASREPRCSRDRISRAEMRIIHIAPIPPGERGPSDPRNSRVGAARAPEARGDRLGAARGEAVRAVGARQWRGARDLAVQGGGRARATTHAAVGAISAEISAEISADISAEIAAARARVSARGSLRPHLGEHLGE